MPVIQITNVLNVLRTGLGLGETPRGSNRNLIVDWYNENVERIGAGPWCEMTNTWGMWTGGAKSLKRPRAYTVWAARDAQQGVNGSSWHWGTKGMRAGDQVYYDWDQRKGEEAYVDHTGTVEKIIGDGTFYVLEGNTGDRLLRRRRDGKYVVGYVRFDWASLQPTKDTTPTKRPVRRKKPSTKLTDRIKGLQKNLRVSADGVWGPITEAAYNRMRTASMAKLGYPRNLRKDFPTREVQRIIGTRTDGVWGPLSQRALRDWVVRIQRFLGVKADGIWGPITDNAYLNFRKTHR